MIEENSFAELAKTCVRAFHVLKIATDRRDIDNSSSPRRQIEDLGRCVDPAQLPLLKMTSDIRTVRHIESAVRERVNYARDSQGHHPGSTDECPVAWRMEMLERLRILDACGLQPIRSESPHGDLGQGDILEVGPIKQHVHGSVDAELLTPPSEVCCCFVISATYSFLNICPP